jgi:DNA-binding beta-propeller fold protein YncE
MEEFQRWGRCRLLGLLVTLAALLLPASAGAADSIYWGNESGDTIQVGNLDGSGSPSSLVAGGGGPCGVALDPAAGKIYWANFNGGQIRVANLDGSNPETLIDGQDNPCGVAIDPSAGRIYWAEFCEIPGATCGTIRGADLEDVPGTAETLVAGEAGPSGVAIDPAAGKIYWTNQSPAGTPPGSVRRANLDGSSPETVVDNQANPLGVAIDAGKIYWTNLGSGAIRAANVADVSNTTTNLFSGENGPGGVAVDPVAGKIYWVNFFDGTVRVGNLDGTGTASTLGASFGGQSNPLLPALLRSPAGTGAPTVSGGAGINQELSCSQGAWAPDLLGAFLYRAPQSFAYEWQKDGVGPILGTDANFTPTEAGSYTCRVTATNRAGSNSQTSAPHSVTANPTVNFVRPAEDATEVQRNAVIIVAFDKAMNKSSAQGAFSLERTSDGAPVNGSFGWYGPGVLLFKPDADLAVGTQYTASVSTAAEDLAGNPLAVAKTWQFTTTNPPTIGFVRPAEDATEVLPNALVVVAFDKAMNKSSAQGAFSLKRTSDGAPVSGSFGWYGPGVLIFKPDADLAPGTQYTASVSTAAEDLAGNPLAVAKTWGFTTTNRPSIGFVRPPVDATEVQPNALVVVAFNKAMDKPSAEAAFSLERTSDGAPVSGTFGWYGPGVLLFKPDADLAAGTQYTAAVSGAAQDLDGNTLTNPLTWHFTTGASG